MVKPMGDYNEKEIRSVVLIQDHPKEHKATDLAVNTSAGNIYIIEVRRSDRIEITILYLLTPYH
jgi:hypothetical protein